MPRNQSKTRSLLPYAVIEKASFGDIEAINKVLKHYEAYINSLSTRKLYDDNGTTHYFIDQEMKRRLETKLIIKLLKFDAHTVG